MSKSHFGVWCNNDRLEQFFPAGKVLVVSVIQNEKGISVKLFGKGKSGRVVTLECPAYAVKNFRVAKIPPNAIHIAAKIGIGSIYPIADSNKNAILLQTARVLNQFRKKVYEALEEAANKTFVEGTAEPGSPQPTGLLASETAKN